MEAEHKLQADVRKHLGGWLSGRSCQQQSLHCSSLPQETVLLAVLKMTGGLASHLSWHSGVSWRREEEASLMIFLLLLCKILLPPLVKAPNRAVVPQPHGTCGHAGDQENAWTKGKGRGRDGMRWLWDIMGTLYPICKVKL